MTKLMTAYSPLAKLLVEALDLPTKNVSRVQLNLEAGSLAEVKITRYIEEAECERFLASLEAYNITAELKQE